MNEPKTFADVRSIMAGPITTKTTQMNKSDSISKLSAALTKAQANIGGATKDARNPFFKSAYADLGEVMKACKEPLLEQGLSVLQLVGHDEAGNYLETIILHESGEWMSDKMTLVFAKDRDPQSMGSAITYARRYALQSALFIPAVDDDAEGAMHRSNKVAVPSELIVHKGDATKGKKVGELTTEQLLYFAEDFKPKTQEDRNLAEACTKLLPEKQF